MGAWIEIIGIEIEFDESPSHPTMGAWIEIILLAPVKSVMRCRTPRWVRGLKFITMDYKLPSSGSHPTMGAWIEIIYCGDINEPITGRTPRWVRGLKYTDVLENPFTKPCRTPRWVRGLKSSIDHALLKVPLSHPTMGAWIEI